MSISLHSATVPVFVHMLRNLSHILDKGEAYAAEKKFDPVALTTFRLAPDMLPFTRQVPIACDAAKNGVARVSGVEASKFEDGEATFAELKARIQKTLDYLAYLMTWVMPNLFFHVTTTYAMLRNNGVPLGKADYLAGAAASQA